jgi:tRNA-2-methylthio-N6-dimethylallyladenosine synthase
VPYVRGQLHNRDYKDILKEIEQALDNGITRITLLGQNVNAYKSPSSAKNFGGPANSCGGHQVTKSPVNFIELLRLINNLAGLKEFSFITSHPKDTTIDLFKAMADLEKLKKHLHLPVQSGSDRILKLMNRGYSRKFYLDLVDNYRKIVKYGFLTTDIIVGFPSETKEDFQASRSLVEEVAFGAAYIFKYSTRPHTEAAKLADELPLQEKERRHRIILELQKEISGKLKAKSEKLKAKSEKL